MNTNFDPGTKQDDVPQTNGEQAAVESASQDQAMEATQESAEEGGVEG
jgi:hypothetical protein